MVFSGDSISALRGCWPLKFLHALEIDRGLLAHTPNGDGTCKIWLKIQGMRAYNLGASGCNVMKLFHATCREAGVPP